MPSLLAQIAAARVQQMQAAGGGMIKRGPVTVYNPNAVQYGRRPAVAFQQPQRVVSRAQERDQRGGQPINWDQVEAAFREDPRVQQKMAERQNKPAPIDARTQAGMDILSGGGGNLGLQILGNALIPIGALGTARRGIEYGMEQFAEHVPTDVQKKIRMVGQAGGGAGLITPFITSTEAGGNIDVARAKADPRNWYQKIADPRSSYGYGELLPESRNIWANRLTGLGVDIMTDPLTYVGGGASRLVGGAPEAAEAMGRAGQLAETTSRLAQEAKVAFKSPEVIAQAESHAAQAASDYEKAVDAFRKTQMLRPIHGGAGSRAQELADFIAQNPGVEDVFKDELQAVGKKGWAAATPELRRAMGIAEPGLRLRGFGTRIPGTGWVSQGTGAATGAGRALLSKVPAESFFSRAPQGLEWSRSVLTKGAPATAQDLHLAAMNQAIADSMRIGQGGVLGGGYRAIRNLVRGDFKNMSRPAIEQAVRDAELRPEPNMINNFFADAGKIYERHSGQKLQVIEDIGADRYFPHVQKPEANRFLLRLEKAGDPRAIAYLNQAGFKTENLLEGSQYLEQSRKLRPSKIGVPTDIPIHDRTITLTNGSVGELNDEMRKVFPEFKGDFYETDPVRVGEAYIESIAKDAGIKRAMLEASRTASPLVHRLEGPLAEEWRARNEAMARQNPIADYIQEQSRYLGPEEQQAAEALGAEGPQRVIQRGAPLTALPERPPMPEDTEIFGKVRHDVGTAEQRRMVRQQGPIVKQTLLADVHGARQDVREVLSDLRTEMRKSIKTETTATNKALRTVERNLKQQQEAFNTLSKQREVTGEELTKFLSGIRGEIADLENEISHMETSYKGRMNRARRVVVNKLKANIEALRNMDADARANIAGAPARTREEASLRADALNAPVKAAQRQVENARAEALRRVGGPDPQRVAWAEEVLTKVSRGDTEQVDALREELGRALQGEGSEALNLRRTTRGRLTAASQRTLDARINELRTALGSAYRPTEYDQAVELLGQKERQLAALPARNTQQIRKLEGEINDLRAKFNDPTGEFYSIRAARATMAEQADAENKIAAWVAPYEAEFRKQQWLRDVKPAPPWEGGHQGVTEQQAINRLNQRARTQILEQEQRIRYAQERMPEMYERLGNVEQEPQLAELARQRAEEIGPVQHVLETAQDLKDITVENQAKRINTLDEQRIGVQRDLHESLDNRKILMDKRRKLMNVERKAYRAGEPMKAKAGQLEGVVSDLRKVAQANPLLDDTSLAATESLLGQMDDKLNEASAKQLRSGAVESAMSKDAKNGKLPALFITALNDNFTMMHKGLLQEGDFIIDKRLDALLKNTIEAYKQPTAFGRAFNAFTNTFKTYATLSPGFHVRNALSAIFMNLSDGVGFGHMIEGVKLRKQYAIGGDEWLAQQDARIQGAFAAVNGSGAAGRYREPGFLGSEGGRLDERISRKLANNPVTRLSQRAGEWVETNVRLGMALDSMDKGETINQALSRISRVHFDYSQISRFDKYAKQFVPFWTFMSRNLPLQVSQMYTKPGAYAAYDSIVRNFGAPPEPNTPEYWTREGAWNTGATVPNLPLGGSQGLPIYLNPDFGVQRAVSQVQELGSLLGGDPRPLLAELNPGFTAPAEYATHSNFFTGQAYGPADYEKYPIWSNFGLTGIPVNVLAALTGNRKQGMVSSNLLNAVRAVNPVMERTARLFPQASGGSELDKQRQLESWLRFGGVPIRTLTPKQQQNEILRKYLEQLDAAKTEQALARKAMAS